MKLTVLLVFCLASQMPAANAVPTTIYRVSPACAKQLGISLKPRGKIMPIPEGAKIETLNCCQAKASPRLPAPAPARGPVPKVQMVTSAPKSVPLAPPAESGSIGTLPGKVEPGPAVLASPPPAPAPNGNPSFSRDRTAIAIGAVAVFAGAALLVGLHEEAKAQEAAKAKALERGEPIPPDAPGWDGPADPEAAHQRAVQAALNKAAMQKLAAAR